MQWTLIRLQRWEMELCFALARLQHLRLSKLLFVTVSRLGDGVLWYALMAALLIVQGGAAIPAVVHMAATGVVGLLLYKLIKSSTRRLRPCESDPQLVPATPALDRYSFPSGHTLHAVAFTMLATAYFPALTLWLVPVAILIAASRVVLGLHYPTDVAAGAAMGGALAYASLTSPIAALFALVG
ncbi:phosphatase PAP2 family protein [Halorhodospira neutriphila]|nr:phosphatase PAP2 family protein [Halorhodospira neutriphila]